MPKNTVDLRVRYGTTPLGPWTTTTPVSAPAGVLSQITLSPLTPGQRYFYHLDCRRTPSGPWLQRPLGSFVAARSSDGTFVHAYTADPHIGQSHIVDTECGSYHDPEVDLTTRTYANIAALRPSLWLELGDITTMHCTQCDGNAGDGDGECTLEGVRTGFRSADTFDEASVRVRLAKRIQADARRQATYVPKQGNHDSRLFGGPTDLCGHYERAGIAADDGWLANFPNPNDVHPHGVHGSGDPENGIYWHQRDGQASNVFVDEYAYACTEGVSCTGGLPDDPGDWTIGVNQKAWLSWLVANPSVLGDVVVVNSHHGFLSGRNACYEYGRVGPLVTVDGLLGSAWNGPEEWMHQNFYKPLLALGKTVIRLTGHDHRFGFITTRDGIHYFTIGQPGTFVAGWLTGSPDRYTSFWDVDGDTVADWNQVASPYYGPQIGGIDFNGHMTIEYDAANPDLAMLRWWSSNLDLSLNNVNTFTYRLELGVNTRITP